MKAEEFWEETLKGHGRLFKRIAAAGLVVLLSLGVAVFFSYRKLSSSLPDAKSLLSHQNSEPSVILDRDGKKIGELFDERRYPKQLDEINPLLIKCFMASEDSRFYDHHGVDWIGFTRATLHFVTRSRSKQGGSTLTQQLAKGLLLTSERTVERKLKDILLALRIEKEMSKDQILELYLNTLFLGNQSYGVESASLNYFRKKNKSLSLAESALIAGLAPAPSAYAPNVHFQRAKVRQKFVLDQMQKLGWATPAEVKAAQNETLKIFDASNPNTKVAPYFFIEVKKILEDELKIPDLAKAGYRIHTTLDVPTQRAAVLGVQKLLKEFEGKKGFKGPIRRHGKKFHEALENMLGSVDASVAQEDEELESSPAESAEVGGAKEAGKSAKKEKAAAKPEDTMTAIVVDLIPQWDAAAVVTERGIGLLNALEHRWALRPVSQGTESGVLDFANILKVGDEVNVSKSAREFPTKKFSGEAAYKDLLKYQEMFSAGAEEPAYYLLTDAEGIEASALAMEATTGNVLAMVGGESFERNQFNRATQAKRQVGSSVKPLYYSLALSHGFSPASKIDTPPLVIGDWKPENYSKEFTGRTTLRTSLIQSFNISSLQLFQALGSSKVSAHFKKYGFHWPTGDLSVALGSGSASLLQMVQAYSPFANQGNIQQARYITKIEDRNGQSVYESRIRSLRIEPVPETHVLSPAAAFVTTRVMQDVVRFGTGTRASGVPFASGKTGTSNNYRDAWFLGVTPYLVGGVWVGFDDPQKSMGSEGTGGRMAAPIWREMMLEAYKRDLASHPKHTADYPEPPGVSYVNVDLSSGDLSPGGTRLPMVVGSEPNSPGARNALGIMASGDGGSGAAGAPGTGAGALGSGTNPESPTNEESDLSTLRGLD